MAKLPARPANRQLDSGARFLRPFSANTQVGRALQGFGRTITSAGIQAYNEETRELVADKADAEKAARAVEARRNADLALVQDKAIADLDGDIERKRVELTEAAQTKDANGDIANPTGLHDNLQSYAVSRAQEIAEKNGINDPKSVRRLEKRVESRLKQAFRDESRLRVAWRGGFLNKELGRLQAQIAQDPTSIEAAKKEIADTLTRTSGLSGDKLKMHISTAQTALTKQHVNALFEKDPELAQKFVHEVTKKGAIKGAPLDDKGFKDAIKKLLPVNKNSFTGKSTLEGLKTSVLGRVHSLLTSMPEQHRKALRIISGHRSHAHQSFLYRKHRAGGPLAAPPGRSKHNFGAAIDVGPASGNYNDPAYKAALGWMWSNSRAHGMVNPPSIRNRDGVHFQEMPGAPMPQGVSIESAAARAREVYSTVTNVNTDGLDATDLAELYENSKKVAKKFAKAVYEVREGGAVINGERPVSFGDKEVKKLVNANAARFGIDALAQGVVAGEAIRAQSDDTGPAGNINQDAEAGAQLKAVVRNSKFIPDVAAQTLAAAVRQGGSARQAALQFMADLEREDPNYVKQSKLGDVAKIVRDYTALTGGRSNEENTARTFMSPAQALQVIDAMKDRTNKQVNAVLKEELKEELSDLTISTIAEGMDHKTWTSNPVALDDSRGAALVGMYHDLYKAARFRGADPDQAKLIADHGVDKAYGQSLVAQSDGTDTVMAFPPEEYFPASAVTKDHRWIGGQVRIFLEGHVPGIPNDVKYKLLPNGQTAEDVRKGRHPSYLVSYEHGGTVHVLRDMFRPNSEVQEFIDSEEFSRQRTGKIDRDAPHNVIRRAFGFAPTEGP